MCVQYSEILLYEGERMEMKECEPLSVWFRKVGINPRFGLQSTALYRGYIGTWEMVDQRLYLVDLEADRMWNEKDKKWVPVNIGTFFPDQADRVFAHWYTGTIELPQGEILEIDGWDTTYEQDLLISIEAGIVTNTEVRVNNKKGNLSEILAGIPPSVLEYDSDFPF